MECWLAVGLALAGSVVAALTLPGCCDGEEQFYEGRVYLLSGADLFADEPRDLAEAETSLLGEGGAAAVGLGVRTAPDMDGDGRAEALIDEEGGSALYLSGDLVGGDLPSSRRAALIGADVVGWAGVVRPVGDVDLDGTGDFAGLSHCGPESESPHLGLCVLPGSDVLSAGGGVLLMEEAGRALTATEEPLECLVVLGDLDGDSLAEVFASGREHGFVVPGARLGGDGSEPLHQAATLQVDGGLGTGAMCPAAAGDVDGDGLPDLWMPAREGVDDVHPYGTGQAVRLLLGSTLRGEGEVGVADASAVVSLGELREGVLATSVGDVDGDGGDDLMVASTPQHSDGSVAFEVRIFLAARLAAGGTHDAQEAETVFVVGDYNAAHSWAQPAAAVGDVDGDGLSDLAVAAPWQDGAAGRVYLLRGSTVSRGGELGATDADGVWVSGDRAALAGFSLGSAGDQDGDGVPDLLVGAPGWRAEPPALDPCHE